MTTRIVIEGVNPYPWRAPKNSTMRRGGKIIPTSYPDPEMVIYQEAVKEFIRDEYPRLELIPPGEHGLHVTFSYWRSLNYGGQRRNPVDVTNLNKALEDALQGLLYDNDRFNRTVTGNMVVQARDIEPLIMITAVQYESEPFDDADMRHYAKLAFEHR